MKAAIYLRVSTEKQDEASQEPECLRLCESRGWQPVIVRERASGRTEREGWRRVLEFARRGEVRAVVFWDLRRIGRRRVEVAHDLEELMRWNVAVASVRNSWLDVADTGPARAMLIQAFGFMAEDETNAIREGTVRGLAAARARGVKLGRPRVVIPLDVLARALELRLLGWGWERVATQLRAEARGPWSARTLERALPPLVPRQKGSEAAVTEPRADGGVPNSPADPAKTTVIAPASARARASRRRHAKGAAPED